MDEIHLFTTIRAATARIATAGTMAAAVNEASPEAGWTTFVHSYGLQNNDKVKEPTVLPRKP
jgi:hypothetical protein